MTVIEKIEKQNNIEEQEFGQIMSKLVFQSFLVNSNNKSHNFLDKKEELIIYFTQFLEKYLDLQFISSKKDKLDLINFIDKMNMQRELLELQRNETDISKIQLAGKRLGKKSQSAFITK
jgi:hypothetical protein